MPAKKTQPASMLLPIIVTTGSVVFWAALSAVSRVVLLRYELSPWNFSFIQLCAGGAVLLLFSGFQLQSLSSFKRPLTWALGFLRVLSTALYTTVLVWISVLEAGILGAISVLITAAAVWLIFGRKPAEGEWKGHLVIVGAILILLSKLDQGISHPAVGLMLLNAVCIVAIAVLAQRHPDNMSDKPSANL